MTKDEQAVYHGFKSWKEMKKLERIEEREPEVTIVDGGLPDFTEEEQKTITTPDHVIIYYDNTCDMDELRSWFNVAWVGFLRDTVGEEARCSICLEMGGQHEKANGGCPRLGGRTFSNDWVKPVIWKTEENR